MRKIDAHHHLWNYKEKEFPWISSDMEILQKNYLPEDLLPILEETEWEGTVVVQARQTLEETEWLLSLAEKYDFMKGVVGWVDLCSNEVESQLRYFSGNPYLKGVRHIVHDEPDPSFMNRSDFKHGLSLLNKYNLTYDLLLFPEHLKLAERIAAHFPEQRFVLDHIGKPNISQQILSPWKEDLFALSRHPNVYCKLSGLVTEANVSTWKAHDFYPYLDVVFEAFDTDRLMIGSDWPVCRLAGEHKEVIDVVVDYALRTCPRELDKIMYENSRKFYQVM
ncbi:amidohydrolase family protein [Alteribacillus sp. HJP-4]|uniref:amidohydrolase family protein n=1 Tax=Alteribacillus sp. HJP-4 TaxID=2775394 RepID=UPI0035CD345F